MEGVTELRHTTKLFMLSLLFVLIESCPGASPLRY
jgi:hypothetical protein